MTCAQSLKPALVHLSIAHNMSEAVKSAKSTQLCETILFHLHIHHDIFGEVGMA